MFADANSKSNLGLKHVNGNDGDNLRTFHINIGATTDSNINRGVSSRSFRIDDCCGRLSSSNQASYRHSSASNAILEHEFHGLLEYNQARRRNHIEQFDNFMVPCSFSQKMLRIPQDDIYQVVMDPVVVGNLEDTHPREHYDLFKQPFIIEGSGTGSQVKDESEAYVKLCLAEEDGYRGNYGSLVSKHERDLSDIDEDGGNSTKPNVFSRIQFASRGAEQSVVQDTAINLTTSQRF